MNAIMNIAVLAPCAGKIHPAQSYRPSSRDLMERALDPYLLVGMPHLTPHGLSETWLMKELGHRHWIMLATQLGMNDADFRTQDGREAYASICATSLRNHGEGLDGARANDILEIRSSLAPVSKTRHASRHHLSIGASAICEVEIVSTFVARSRHNDNHSLVRVEQGRAGPAAFMESTLAIRAGELRRQLGGDEPADHSRVPPGRTVRLTPDPLQDFNGAGLLYFANFQALFSRAIAELGGAATVWARRELFFFGNIQPGETVTVHACVDADDRLSLFMRRSGGKIIAAHVACGHTEEA